MQTGTLGNISSNFFIFHLENIRKFHFGTARRECGQPNLALQENKEPQGRGMSLKHAPWSSCGVTSSSLRDMAHLLGLGATLPRVSWAADGFSEKQIWGSREDRGIGVTSSYEKSKRKEQWVREMGGKKGC